MLQCAERRLQEEKAMKELVEQVTEAQKNVRIVQMKLVKGRQQIGTAGSQAPRGLPHVLTSSLITKKLLEMASGGAPGG